MNDNTKSTNSEILLSLINNQIDKIIKANYERDPYFSIRQNFDADQFLWEIATKIYSSIGEKIDFVEVATKIKQSQDSAYKVYANEQERQKQEETKIFLEKAKERKRFLRKEIESLEVTLKQMSYLKKPGGLTEQIAQKSILGFQNDLLCLLHQEKELILVEIDKAQKDYNFDLAARLQYGIFIDIESQIEKINQDLSRTEIEIEAKLQEKENHFLNIIRQVENSDDHRDSLIKILELIESQLEIDYKKINLNSDLHDDLGCDELDRDELIMGIEELLNIELTDEDWESVYDIKRVLVLACVSSKLGS